MFNYLSWYPVNSKKCTACKHHMNCAMISFNVDVNDNLDIINREFIEKYNAICQKEFNCNIEELVICYDCLVEIGKFSSPPCPLSPTPFFDSFENLLSTKDCLKLLGQI